ncbi:MAG TPA: ATP-binding protein [Pyrinomonadaceae bacterium]|nr:ATP-binding protein [Pyrinomonadaceae bacterium]
MSFNDFIDEAFCNPVDYISYYVSRKLAELYPEKFVIESTSGSFEPWAFVRADQCSVVRESAIHAQWTTDWHGPDKKLWQAAENGWFNILWNNELLDVLLMTYTDGGCKTRHYWIVADTREIAEGFFRAVCKWNSEVRGEIMIYDGGYWNKSEELYQEIKGATFENLILKDALKQEISDDITQFFGAREVYEKYGIPWKRGILFIGPPGNGKTHTVKALINASSKPCLYVKSFKSQYDTDQDNMRDVFIQARQSIPCIVVLEDLDSMIDANNRSFFLNELDGFASNTGVVVIATTNHPERLDTAILDRPSRFDRKYYFELPAQAERRSYIRAWNDALQTDMRLSEPVIDETVERTEGFSFAYLKELFLSSMMQWIAHPSSGSMDGFVLARTKVLREQMTNAKQETEETKSLAAQQG